MDETQKTLGNRRWLILASAVVSFFAVGTSFFAVPPLIPQLTAIFGLSHFQIGVLVGAIAVPAVFLSIPLGAAIDRWDPKAAGNVGLLLMVVGACLFAAAPAYWALLAGRFLFGIGGLVLNLLLARLLTEAFAGRELALAMGIFMAVYPAGMIVLFSVHPVLLETLSWRGELFVLAGLAVIAVPVHNLAVPAGAGQPAETLRSDEVPQRVLGMPLIALGMSWMLFFAAFASVPTFAPQWAGGQHRGLLTVTIVMWVALVLSPVLGAVIDRLGRPVAWLVTGLVLLAGTLVLMAGRVVAPIPAMLLVGLCAAAVPTATYALPGRLVAPQRVGFAFGFITALSNLGTIVGPAAAGALRDATGAWATTWAVLAVAAAVAAGVAAMIRLPRASLRLSHKV